MIVSIVCPKHRLPLNFIQYTTQHTITQVCDSCLAENPSKCHEVLHIDDYIGRVTQQILDENNRKNLVKAKGSHKNIIVDQKTSVLNQIKH